jgi:multidrug efflux pump subunit AcrA (membrane-fusion protein)
MDGLLVLHYSYRAESRQLAATVLTRHSRPIHVARAVSLCECRAQARDASLVEQRAEHEALRSAETQLGRQLEAARLQAATAATDLAAVRRQMQVVVQVRGGGGGDAHPPVWGAAHSILVCPICI